MRTSEADERAYLAGVQARLREALQQIDAKLQRYAHDIQDQKTYLWESKADMDHVEKVFTRQTIEQSVLAGEAVDAQRGRLQKLIRSPYFGRFDFVPEGRERPEPIYVGVHHFSDDRERTNLVYDWRAPIATMFYDHETGPASYEAPSGDVQGEITLKRQFRIRDGQLEFMLDSAVNIMDDLLQEELSRASDEGMRQIVATIQRDQNAIIRNADAPVLIIQGVAGSGKTSIALHRIAFLLYRFRDTLSSSDILIISPNRVFADYISNVLPELGEETVSEIGMETLADELLDRKVRFQSFIEQTALLLEKDDPQMRRRIEVKASADFLSTLDEYADHVEQSSFAAENIWLERRLVPDWFVDEHFRRHRGVSLTERVALVVRAIEQNIGIYYNHDVTTEERGEIRRAVRKMYTRPTLRAAYKGLYDWMEEPALFKPAKGGTLEYADVFPLIYLKMRLEGLTSERREVKHLLIDEMQDYTPVQYAVIARVFTCRKTILGDARQSVNPYSASTAESIQGVFRQATCVKLCKSYRSTLEITRFAQRISPNPDLVAIERHGEAPEVLGFRTERDEMDHVRRMVEAFPDSGFTTMGIICKTQPQADRLHTTLREAALGAHLLNPETREFRQGVTVCTAHLAKGLEFDQVIVPGIAAKHYHTSMDRSLLYVACTRAMHSLTLTFAGEPTPLVDPPATTAGAAGDYSGRTNP